MRTRKVIVWSLALTGLMFAASVGSGQQTRRIDDAALRNAGKTGEEWLTYGLTPGETRFSPLKQVDVSNGRRHPGSNAAVLERHALWHHKLERRLCCRCAHREGTLAVGSGSQSSRGPAENLLRGCESRHCHLSGKDRCARN